MGCWYRRAMGRRWRWRSTSCSALRSFGPDWDRAGGTWRRWSSLNHWSCNRRWQFIASCWATVLPDDRRAAGGPADAVAQRAVAGCRSQIQLEHEETPHRLSAVSGEPIAAGDEGADRASV